LKKGKAFFFEKKKQKTFRFCLGGASAPRPAGKSLFASFSSEKEVLPYLKVPPTPHH
jgi:hypothetical protein